MSRALIVTFHIGRSGSTVLGDLLDQHPAIRWLGEIEEWDTYRTRNAAPGAGSELTRRVREQGSGGGKPLIGVEAKFYHLHRHQVSLPTFIDELLELGARHFIVLRRRNFLRKVVSSLAARERHRWTARPGESLAPVRLRMDPERVRIDGDDKSLLEYFEDWDAAFDELDALIPGNELLRLFYEDDIAEDPRRGYARVCAHVGLEPQRPDIRYVRVNPQPLRDLVINLDEVQSALASTPYAWMAADAAA
jgi:hypothetical protein